MELALHEHVDREGVSRNAVLVGSSVKASAKGKAPVKGKIAQKGGKVRDNTVLVGPTRASASTQTSHTGQVKSARRKGNAVLVGQSSRAEQVGHILTSSDTDTCDFGSSDSDMPDSHFSADEEAASHKQSARLPETLPVAPRMEHIDDVARRKLRKDLKREANALMSGAVARKTKALYRNYWSQFAAFCKRLHLPLSKNKVMEAMELWVASLSRQGVNHGSVLLRLSAIRHKLKKHKTDIQLSSNRLQLMLKGLKKRRRVLPDKTPVTLSKLTRLHRASDRLRKPTAMLLKAMSTLAFFGFLRPSEMCVSSSNHYLRRGDIRLGKKDRCCYIRFRTFKHSDRAQTICINDHTHAPIKPVKIIKLYMDSTVNAARDQPLFDLTVAQFRKLLEELCQLAKIKSKITPHCFRVGGATWASKQGWSDARIQQHGRWRSGAFKTYIKPY